MEKLSDYFLSRRLIAPNVQKKVFLPGGATATSTSAVQVWRNSGLETETERDRHTALANSGFTSKLELYFGANFNL